MEINCQFHDLAVLPRRTGQNIPKRIALGGLLSTTAVLVVLVNKIIFIPVVNRNTLLCYPVHSVFINPTVLSWLSHHSNIGLNVFFFFLVYPSPAKNILE